MATYGVHSVLRPVRSVTIIPPTAAGLKWAVSRYSSLWGGAQNLIVPWGVVGYAEDDVHSLVDRADPDHVWLAEELEDPALSKLPRSLRESTLFPPGLSVNAVLSTLRRPRVFNVNGESEDLLTTVICGSTDNWQSEDGADLWQAVTTLGQPADLACPRPDTLRPVDVCSHRLGRTDGALSVDDYVFYVLEPNDVGSLCTLWNVRSTGRYVIPIPVTGFEAYDPAIAWVLDRSVYRRGSEPYVRHLILYDEALSAEVVEPAVAHLVARGATKRQVDHIPVTAQGLLRSNYRSWPAMFPETRPVTIDGDTAHFFAAVPPLNFDGRDAMAHYACEFRFGVGEPLIFGSPWPSTKYAGSHHRVTRTGIVCTVQAGHTHVVLKGASVYEALNELVTNAGWKGASVSTAGRALERIIEHMGGLEACDTLTYDGVRDVLRHLEGGSRSMRADEVLRSLGKSRDRFDPRPEELLDLMVEKAVLRPGLEFQCRICERHDWYHVGEFGAAFKCHWCFNQQPTPRVDNRRWHYKSDGFFTVRGGIDGALSVVSAVRFLTDLGHWATPYLYPSFVLSGPGSESRELDFALLLPWTTQVVIAEVKTHRELSEAEVQRTARVAKSLKGFAAFCTMEEQFTDAERALFAAVRSEGVPTLLLTGKVLKLRGMRKWSFLQQVAGQDFNFLKAFSKTTEGYVLDGQFAYLFAF